MYDTFEKDDLIVEKFHLNSKIIGINDLFHHGIVDQRDFDSLSDQINNQMLDLIEKDLPSYIAVASNNPSVLEEIHSDAVKDSITAINQQLDQQFGTSADSFEDRKEVLERVSYIFRHSILDSVEKIDSSAGQIRNVINHPDKPNASVDFTLRPLMNGEFGKYDFSREATSDLFKEALVLGANFSRTTQDAHFLFLEDIEDNILMKYQSEKNGTVYPRSDQQFVTAEISQIKNQIDLINSELESRNPSHGAIIVEDRAANGANPANIGYDDRDRGNAGLRR